jgi:hypothetical protein
LDSVKFHKIEIPFLTGYGRANRCWVILIKTDCCEML